MAEVALRETIDADLGTLFEFQADPEASAMAAFPSRDLPAFLERQARIKADPSAITRTIVAAAGVVGSIGSWEVEGERDVGFWIGRDHWGNGYATAALRALVRAVVNVAVGELAGLMVTRVPGAGVQWVWPCLLSRRRVSGRRVAGWEPIKESAVAPNPAREASAVGRTIPAVSYWSTKSDLEFMERFHADVKALWALEDKYEEAARRRNFRDLSDPPNVEDDPEYQKVREAVARGISRASHIAARLRVPVGLTSYPAPAVGGPIIQTNLFEVILRDTTHRGIPRQDIVDGLNRTVGASEEEVRAERRHVLNPAWWGLQAIAFILRVPLEVAVMMGADRSKLEKEVWPRVLSAVLSAWPLLHSSRGST